MSLSVVAQQFGHCGLPTSEVLVFLQWWALKDVNVVEIVTHPIASR
jgi:hypothetical protein